MREIRQVANVAVFTSLVVGTNFALSEAPNVKLDGAIVFLATILFGVAAGASVAVLSELIWSQVSPWGVSGAYLIPFLVTAELLYVIAGWITTRVLNGDYTGVPRTGLLCAGMLGVSTFAWDLWTNLGTAALVSNLSFASLLFWEFNPLAIAFDLTHEVSNLALGLSVVPASLLIMPKLRGGLMRRSLN